MSSFICGWMPDKHFVFSGMTVFYPGAAMVFAVRSEVWI